MTIINKYGELLHNGIYLIQAIAYTISFVIISMSILRSTVKYFHYYNKPELAYYNTRLDLSESISIALSFILGVEILKLFYIKSYKQLIFIVCLVSIKLLVSYFLTVEIEKSITPNGKKYDNFINAE